MNSFKKIATLILILFSIIYEANAQTQDDKVLIEIIDPSKPNTSVKVYIDWPYEGSPPIGAGKKILNKIETKLREAGVDCPPKQRKLSSYIWECGNGKLVRVKDKRVAMLFSSMWVDE